jgi:hypothetical protein
MKKVKNLVIVPILALAAFVFIAARSAESTEPQQAQPSLSVGNAQGGMNEGNLTAPTSAEPAITVTEKAPVAGKFTVQPTEHKLSLKEKVAAKIIANQVKKEMRKAEMGKTTGGKSQLVALLLCIFVGYLGIHRFYLGYTGIGILELLTAGLCGILTLIDLIRIITGDLQPKGGEYETTI